MRRRAVLLILNLSVVHGVAWRQVSKTEAPEARWRFRKSMGVALFALCLNILDHFWGKRLSLEL